MSGYNAKAFETKANEELFTHSVAESLDVASEDGIKIAGGCLLVTVSSLLSFVHSFHSCSAN